MNSAPRCFFEIFLTMLIRIDTNNCGKRLINLTLWPTLWVKLTKFNIKYKECCQNENACKVTLIKNN
jgi:hypothetical protein